MAHDPTNPKQHAEFDRAVLFRWEKNDFADCKVHVSCPKCSTLSKHSLDLLKSRLQCPTCPFSGLIAYDAAGLMGYEEWMKQRGTAGAPEDQAIPSTPAD